MIVGFQLPLVYANSYPHPPGKGWHIPKCAIRENSKLLLHDVFYIDFEENGHNNIETSIQGGPLKRKLFR